MRLTRLATGLLDVERAEQGKLVINPREILLAPAVRNAATLGAPEAEVHVDVEPDLQVRADPEHLEQILVNLVANALRHGLPPVLITAQRATDTVRIDDRDHGPGIPADRQDTIFGRLSGDSDHPDSVGLGMWIVRMLAEAHGGTVSYHDADPGARFSVHLPTR